MNTFEIKPVSIVTDTSGNAQVVEKSGHHNKFSLIVGCVGVVMAGIVAMKTLNTDGFNNYDSSLNPYGSELSIYPSDTETSGVETYQTSKLSDKDIEKHILTENISSKWHVDSGFAQRVVNSVYNESRMYDLDPKLVLSIIAVESSFKKNAVSKVGAEGLMQVWRKWHKEKFEGIGTRTSIEEDIGIGVKVFHEYMNKEQHNTARALQRYNGSLSDRAKVYPTRVLTQFKDFKQTLKNMDKDTIREKLIQLVQVKQNRTI